MSITTISNPEEIKKITFPGQYGDEQILLIKRRHPITLLGFALALTISPLVPLFVYYFLPLVLDAEMTEIFQKLFLFITGIYLLFLCIFSFFVIIDYYLDVWIITDKRIMAVEQKGLFRRIVTEINYNRIEDITSEVSGIMATYFQFGNILIQTAAKEQKMKLRQITHPIETRRIISDAYRKVTEQKNNLTI